MLKKTTPPIFSSSLSTAATISNCGKLLKANGYQALDESLMWLRKKLRYGKNATYDKENKKSLEIDNPQPSIYVHNDENMMKVQRLNGIGSEEFNQLQ